MQKSKGQPTGKRPSATRADGRGSSSANSPLEMQVLTIFGKNLRFQRQKLGVTQDELAARSGVDRSHISDIERGANSPTLVVIFRLATGLGLRIIDLFENLDGHISEHARSNSSNR